jgi:GNAT superfamily N-acetyltransferase
MAGRSREGPRSNVVDMTELFTSTAELDELAMLAQETFVEAYADDLDREVLARYADRVFVPELMAELASGGTAVRVVRDRGAAVAYATVRSDEAGSRSASRLGRIYVRPDHHRRGLGRLLVTWAVETARSSGMADLCLGVWERNHRAIAFYEAMGFVACGDEAFTLEGQVQRDVVMRLPLDQRPAAADRSLRIASSRPAAAMRAASTPPSSSASTGTTTSR